MPFNYLACKRMAALRLAQLKGSDATTLEAAYAGAWASALDGAEIPLSAFKDQILMIEKECAQVIGNNASHPARSLLYGRSADLANLASTPSVDENDVEFVGIFDSCADSADSQPLTWQPTQTLADVADPFWGDTALYYYNITGNQIRHTRSLAYLQGCIWSQTAQATAYDADGNSPLPQMCANLIVNGVCANSVQVGWSDNVGAAQVDHGLYQQGLQILMSAGNVPIAAQNAVAG